jgi:hypothetical protein
MSLVFSFVESPLIFTKIYFLVDRHTAWGVQRGRRRQQAAPLLERHISGVACLQGIDG